MQMQLLAFDGRMGASGDMLLGALIAAGANPDCLDVVEETLECTYEIHEVARCGISATKVDVRITDGGENEHSHTHLEHDTHSHEENHAHSHEEGHSHNHEDDHAHSHAHEHGGDEGHSHAEGAGVHRTYLEVVEFVESMNLPESVEEDALAIFELLGKAEAAVHGTDLESTHFHEVGADDAIADIVGVSLLLADLDVDRVVTTPVSTGGGTVKMSHGIYPVPPPAVVELAEEADWSLRGGPLDVELLTPTGAAILAYVADGVDSLPALDITGGGYGAGSNSFDTHPNVLRALVGESEGGLRQESITVLETHLDDATPEVLGGLSDTLAAVGALDVTIVPTTMKKSRPGHLIKVVVHPADASRVARELANETGTLGVREHGSGHRFVAGRTVEPVTVDIDNEEYTVAVKIARFSEPDGSENTDGVVFDVSCEYDDALEVATATGYPVRDILRRAEVAARKKLDLEE